jgi:hypothetical protein
VQSVNNKRDTFPAGAFNNMNDTQNTDTVTAEAPSLPRVPLADYNPNVAITVEDLSALHTLSRLTVTRKLKEAQVAEVAVLDRKKAGRPPRLFARDAAERALAARRTDNVADVAADAQND